MCKHQFENNQKTNRGCQGLTLLSKRQGETLLEKIKGRNHDIILQLSLGPNSYRPKDVNVSEAQVGPHFSQY